MKSSLTAIIIALSGPITIILMLILTRSLIETRELQTNIMTPILAKNDRVLIEKLSTFLNKPCPRGEIILYTRTTLSNMPRNFLTKIEQVSTRLTGLSDNEPAFLTKVIAVPGDHIRVTEDGCYLNDTRLNATVGPLSLNGGQFGKTGLSDPTHNLVQDDAFIVPVGYLFTMVNNTSIKSDLQRLIRTDQVIGRVQLRYYPSIKIIEPQVSF